MFTPAASLAVMVAPVQLFSIVSTGAGVEPGTGVTELLAALTQPFSVLVAVTAVVAVTVIGLPVDPLLHVSWAAGMFTPAASLAVMVAPVQLFSIESTGAVGVCGCASITTSADAGEVQPDALVTVKV